MSTDLEQNSNENEAQKERPRFIHKPNPLVQRAYQVFEFNHNKNDYVHAGDYILINHDESREITEKKVLNLMSLLNGKQELIDLSNLTKSRVLYTIVPEAQDSNQTKIIFKDYDGTGVSKDNAVFTIRKGVLHDG
ncbi:MAG: hypothetical protein GC137_04650 [Alphaproteobacteria bacterium]|nr:hypothetical protein [Alphaproteobacteria bacterium]